MKKNFLIVLLIGLVLLVAAGCSNTATNSDPASQEIETLTESYMEEIEVVIAVADFNDEQPIPSSQEAAVLTSTTSTQETSLTVTAENNPEYARYWNFSREKMEWFISDIVVDEELGTGKVTLTITIPGEVVLYDETYELIGVKDIIISGTGILDFEKMGDSWIITDKSIDLKTVNSSLVIDEPQISPQPVAPGDELYINKVVITGIDEGEDIRGRIRVHRGKPTRKLAENDGYYTSDSITINPNAMPGNYLGIIKAVKWGSVVDASKDENGDFITPVEMNLKSFTVDVE